MTCLQQPLDLDEPGAEEILGMSFLVGLADVGDGMTL